VNPNEVPPRKRFRMTRATFSGSSVAWVMVEIFTEKAFVGEFI